MENGRGFISNYLESRRARQKARRGNILVVHGPQEDGYSMMPETEAERMAANPDAPPMSYVDFQDNVVRARTVGSSRKIASFTPGANKKASRRLW